MDIVIPNQNDNQTSPKDTSRLAMGILYVRGMGFPYEAHGK